MKEKSLLQGFLVYVKRCLQKRFLQNEIKLTTATLPVRILCLGICCCWLGSLTQRSSQWAFLAVIFPFSKSERGGKRGSTTPDDCWVLGFNPRFHVLFRRCRQGQNDADKVTKMSTISVFLPNFSPLGCEGSRGSHLTTRLFTSTAAADRPRAGMPAPISHT